MGRSIPAERLHECVNVILSYQNPGGGWATYENTRWGGMASEESRSDLHPQGGLSLSHFPVADPVPTAGLPSRCSPGQVVRFPRDHQPGRDVRGYHRRLPLRRVLLGLHAGPRGIPCQAPGPQVCCPPAGILWPWLASHGPPGGFATSYEWVGVRPRWHGGLQARGSQSQAQRAPWSGATASC